MRWRCASLVVLLAGCFDEPSPVESGGSETTSSDGTGSSSTSNASSSPTTTPPATDDTAAVTSDDGGSSEGSSGAADTSSDGDTSSSGGPGQEALLVSLHEALCDAEIRSYEDPACGLSCSMPVECNTVTTVAGHAVALGTAPVEDIPDASRVIELATYATPTGLVTAHFDGIALAGTTAPRVRASAWCSNAASCETWWQVEVVVGEVPVDQAEGVQTFDGAGEDIDLDLSSYIGESIRITLRMSNHGAAEEGDRIRFVDPRVVDLR